MQGLPRPLETASPIPTVPRDLVGRTLGIQTRTHLPPPGSLTGGSLSLKYQGPHTGSHLHVPPAWGNLMLSWSLASLAGTGSSWSFSEMKVEVVFVGEKDGERNNEFPARQSIHTFLHSGFSAKKQRGLTFQASLIHERPGGVGPAGSSPDNDTTCIQPGKV